MFAITGKFLLINICVFKNIQTHTRISASIRKDDLFHVYFSTSPLILFPDLPYKADSDGYR